VHAEDDLLLISRKGQSIRFQADDTQLRPMGRATSGVTGMRFREGDELLSMSVILAETVASGEPHYVFTVTDGGFAKKTDVQQYRRQGRGGLGIKAARLSDERGQLVAGLVVNDTDEVLAVRASGQVTRSAVAGVLPKGRDTMGLTFAKANGDPVVAIARNAERDVLDDEAEETVSEASEASPDETTAQES